MDAHWQDTPAQQELRKVPWLTSASVLAFLLVSGFCQLVQSGTMCTYPLSRKQLLPMLLFLEFL